jgi:hypothetical protein
VVLVNTWQWRQLDSGGVAVTGSASTVADSMEEEGGAGPGRMLSEKLMFLQARLQAVLGPPRVSPAPASPGAGAAAVMAGEAGEGGAAGKQREGGGSQLGSEGAAAQQQSRRLLNNKGQQRLLRRPAAPPPPPLW